MIELLSFLIIVLGLGMNQNILIPYIKAIWLEDSRKNRYQKTKKSFLTDVGQRLQQLNKLVN